VNRRNFAQSIGGAAALSSLANAEPQTPARKTRIYRLDFYRLRQGSQGTRLNEFLQSQRDLLVKNSQGLGVFTAIFGPHLPSTVVLTGFSGMEEMEAADERVRRAPEYHAALEKLDTGAEPAYDRMERVLLRATDFSPEIVPLKEAPKKPRYFELRVYHAPTERQLRFVDERFNGPEIPIFHRSGVHPILYAHTIAGPEMPNLTYLIPFDDLAQREKAWDAFAADPEWVKAREASIARGGQIVADQNISLLRAAPFSPIQ
jgi:hypothetical protein